MNKYNIAILGLGAIFNRHLEAIMANHSYYNLVGVFDVDSNKCVKVAQELGVKAYTSEDEVYLDTMINCVAILTPSHLHFNQMIKSINADKNIIVEKPATFTVIELNQVMQLAQNKHVDVFTILQVRLNPSIIAVKQFVHNGYMGNIRGVSLTQRWQRPPAYFTGWRGQMSSGGGILREFTIHYLDALIGIFGSTKKINFASFYNTKFMNTDVSDTIYVNLDFGKFAGNIEVSIGAEPKNIECNLCIMSDVGYIKLGGKSLDVITEAQFLDNKNNDILNHYYQEAINNSHTNLASSGASPYHPELYKRIVENPPEFKLSATLDVIRLVEDIYSFSSCVDSSHPPIH